MIKYQCQKIINDISEIFLTRKISIYKILTIYSKEIDKLLIEFFPKELEHMSLIAIGGYGRKERALYSDIDLLVLAEKEKNLNNMLVSKFIQKIHDLPFKIGYSTHTKESIVQHIKTDINLLTALLDARLICGNVQLFEKTNNLVFYKKNLSAIKKFIYAKYAEQIKRDENFPINQQPDLKNTVGNLRYIHSIHWILKYMHPQTNFTYLIKHGYITKHELKSLRKAHHLLSCIRFYLHILYQREQNLLLIDQQLNIANFFGFKHKNSHKSIKLFMQNYYNSIRHIKLINRTIFHEFIAKHSDDKSVKINGEFIIKNGILKHHLHNYPEKISDILVPFKYFCQYQNIKSLDSNILRNIRKLILRLNEKI